MDPGNSPSTPGLASTGEEGASLPRTSSSTPIRDHQQRQKMGTPAGDKRMGGAQPAQPASKKRKEAEKEGEKEAGEEAEKEDEQEEDDTSLPTRHFRSGVTARKASNRASERARDGAMNLQLKEMMNIPSRCEVVPTVHLKEEDIQGGKMVEVLQRKCREWWPVSRE